MDEEQVQREIQKTLGLLSPSSELKPKPFFYTRLKERMRERLEPEQGLARLMHHKVLLAIAGLVLLVGMNTYALLHHVTLITEIRNAQAFTEFTREYGIPYHRYF